MHGAPPRCFLCECVSTNSSSEQADAECLLDYKEYIGFALKPAL